MRKGLLVAIVALAAAHASPAMGLDLYARGQIFYKEAIREVNTLNTSTSYYWHGTYMNEDTGTRRTDCSGYVDYAIRRVLPDAYEKVPHPNTQRPLADDWYRYLKERYQSPSTASFLTDRRKKGKSTLY